MKKLSPFMVLDYIRSTIEILMDKKQSQRDSKSEFSSTTKSYDYETLLRQMEGESREHIAVKLL